MDKTKLLVERGDVAENDAEQRLATLQVICKETGEFTDLIQRVAGGLEKYAPEMCEEGLNGTYFLKDKDGNMAAVFKPEDEEGNSVNNPKKSDSTLCHFERGILEGEGAQREVAAYLLDKEEGFAGVPRTTMVKILHPSFGRDDNGQIKEKIGSLQEFVSNDGASWDVGFGVFPVHEVHKIAIFDLRIFNNDRHGGNMLMIMEEDGYKLTPIDHGFSLSANLDHAWFDWLTWPQVKKPFSQEAKDYIERINIDQDLKTLAILGIRPECLKTMKISTMLLKKGCHYGLTLFDIGTIVSRAILEEPSELEIWYLHAVKEMGLVDGEIKTENEENQLLDIIARIMDKELGKNKHTVQPSSICAK